MTITEWKHIIEARMRLCLIILGRTLTVREFRGSSKSPTLWTSKRAMQSWNSQRYIFGLPIPVGFAFKRPWERWAWIPVATLCAAWLLMLVKVGLMLRELLLEIVL